MICPKLFSTSMVLVASMATAQTPSIQWDVKVPMRDGVNLAAVVFRTHEQKDPLPAILCLTPYTSANPYRRGRYFAENGYVFVSVDIRGRGNSEGVFDPCTVQDGKDGHDLVEWIAKQPWCNGKVAMWGGSYAGYTQWMTAREFPPHLASIVPAASLHTFYDFPTNKGVDTAWNPQWMVLTGQRTNQEVVLDDEAFWSTSNAAFATSGLPFRQMDRWAGLPSPVFQRWLNRPVFDAGWEATLVSPEAYRKLTIPILTITGHYDDDQVSAMTYYRNHGSQGTVQAWNQHYLVMGPWDHGGTRTPAKEVEGVTFGDAAMLDMNALHKAWYDWTLKGGPKPDFLKQRVACYVAGDEKWVHADRLEDLTKEAQTLYLKGSPGGGKPGALALKAPELGMLGTLVHDPLDLSPAAWERRPIKGGKLTQPDAAMIYTGRQFLDHALVFKSEPLPDGALLCGSPRLSLWVRMDVPDADFFAAIFEEKPDGSVIQLGQDVLRARYRDGMRSEKLVKAGEPVHLDFSAFPFVARSVAKGSRLKLAIGCIDTIYAQKNHHSGGSVADETRKVARVANIQVLGDAGHSAMLEVPVGQHH